MRFRRLAVLAAAALLLRATAAPGQEPQRDSIPSDVRVGILYQPLFLPGVVVPAIQAPEELRELADSARAIILRDLDYSDRFQVIPLGGDVPSEGPINYGLWDEMGAVWLVAGSIEGPVDRPVLRISLHDVVFRLLQDVREFDLQPLGHRDARLAIHVASDAVVGWATGSPGMSATRIAYVESTESGSEIYLVDSDGFERRRLTNDGSIALSPAWSPSGDRIALMSYKSGEPAIYEVGVNPGLSQLLADLPGLNMTPAYAPDGLHIAFAATVEDRTEIHLYNRAERCCLKRITFARFANSLSPTFSPDGRRLAFNSDRLGQLHIFVQGLEDTSAQLITPYIYDRSIHNAGPDWSPQGDRIAFHGWVGGVPQIFTVGPDGRGLRQLTQATRNEDPSWAPDGRHIVFASTRDGVPGLWILDVVSGRIRRLVRGRDARLPDWSGRLDSPSHSTDQAGSLER